MAAIRYKPVIRMYIGNDWRDITEDVRVTEPITIRYGARDESTKLNPATCDMKLNDPNGDYNPSDPMGRWFGLIGRNNRVEILREWFTDYFDRTVSGGFGSSPAGEEWTGYSGTGGTVLFSDFNVTGHYATMSVPVAAGFRRANLGTHRYRDVDVVADVTVLENPDGGDLEPGNVILRLQDSGVYYMVRVVLPAAASVPTITFHHSSVGQLATPVGAGFTYDHATPMRVRAQAEGQTLRAKVWQVGSAEPKAWQVEVHDDRIQPAGFIGIRNGVGSGNTDPKPVVFRVNRFVASSPRMVGEMSEVKAGVDSAIIKATGETRVIRWTRITVAGIIRRLAQGRSPRQSPMRRKVASLSSLVAYWPCEDPKTAVVPAGHPGTESIMSEFWISGVSLGRAKMASYGGFYGADDVPEPSGGIWIGPVGGYTDTGVIETQLMAQIPEDSTDGSTVLEVETTGTKALYVVDWRAGGSMSVATWAPGAQNPTIFGPYGFLLGSNKFKIQFILKQVGANITFNLAVLFELKDDGTSYSIGTGNITAQTGGALGRVVNVVANPSGMLKRGGLGHMFVRNADSGASSFLNEFSGFHTERALTRFLRIGGEEAIPVAYWGLDSDTVQMGVQDQDTAMGHFQDIADTDMGILTEPRGGFGLHYRSRVSLYRQSPVITLSLPTQIRPGFQPDFDDKFTRNDITARRAMSGDYRIARTTGPMSSADPPAGVGRADDSPALNPAKLAPLGGGVQARDGVLPDLAGWRLALGTVDEPRFPVFAVDMSGLPAASERALFDLTSGDRLDVTDMRTVGIYGTTRQVVRGYSETFTNHSWILRPVTAPYAPYDVGALDDTVATAARLGSTALPIINAGSNPPTGITSTATSFVVDTITDVWVTTATHPTAFPFSAMIGGEEITVTGMSSSFFPLYTVTCVRSINGVVKSHTIGTTMSLKRPLRLSL